MTSKLLNTASRVAARTGLDICSTYAPSQGAIAVTVQLEKVLRKIQHPVMLVYLSARRIVECENDRSWVDSFVLRAATTFGRTEPLIVFIICPPGTKAKAEAAIRRQVLSEGQPILRLEDIRPIDSMSNLGKLIASRAAPKLVSPYRIDQPARFRMLMGRRRLLKKLIDDRRHQVIVGPRRIGKTSLSLAMRDQLRALAKAGESAARRCGYIDVASLGKEASSRIWHESLKSLGFDYPEYSAYGRRANITKKRGGKEAFEVDEQQALENILRTLPERITLILDEVDKWIERGSNSRWETLDKLRSIADQGNAKLILVGYESLAIAYENEHFPFFDRAEKTFVGPIDYTAVEKLVLEPLEELGIELKPRDQILSSIWNDSSGLPIVIQDICNHLVELKWSAGDKDRPLSFAEYENALNSSGAMLSVERVISTSTFPLAIAIAGIVAQGGTAELQDLAAGDKRESTAPKGTSRALTRKEIIRHLMTAEVVFEFAEDEFELALEYLQIRQVLQPADRERTRWRWLNHRAMRATARRITGTGYQTWLQGILKKHASGKWRARYQQLGRFQ